MTVQFTDLKGEGREPKELWKTVCKRISAFILGHDICDVIITCKINKLLPEQSSSIVARFPSRICKFCYKHDINCTGSYK